MRKQARPLREQTASRPGRNLWARGYLCLTLSVFMLLGFQQADASPPTSTQGRAEEALLKARESYRAGTTAQKSGRINEANRSFETALRYATEADDRVVLMLSRLGCGQTLSSLGRPAEALDHFLAASDLAQPGPGDRVMLLARRGEIACRIDQGDLLEARDLCEATLASYPQAPADAVGALHALHGRALFRLGDFEQARCAFLKSLEIAATGNERKVEIVSRTHLANIDWVVGNFARARTGYEEVSSLAHESAAPLAEADGIMGQGLVAQALGFWNKAATHYREAALLARSVRDHRRLGFALNNLALVEMHQEAFERARAHFAESIELLQAAGDVSGAALSRSNLGDLFLEQGQTADAVGELKAAEKTLTRGGYTRGLAVNHLRLGRVLFERKDDREAGREFRSARELSRKIRDREVEWRALYGMGRIEEAGGHPDQALKTYLEALRLFEDRYRELGPPSVDLVFRTGVEDLYGAVIRLMIREHRNEEAFGFAERNRSRRQEERLGAPAFRASGNARKRAEDLQRNRERLLAYEHALANLSDDSGSPRSEIRDAVDRKMSLCRANHGNLLRDLGQAGPAGDVTPTGAGIPLDRICRSIPSDVVLIEYFMSDRELLLFTMSREGLRVFPSPISRRLLDEACGELRTLIYTSTEDGASRAGLEDLSAFLFEKLVAPAWDVVKTKKVLGIIPHGETHNIPFSVLLRREGAAPGRYLIADHNVFHMNVRDWEKFLSGSESGPVRLEFLVGFADPESTLPGSREELLRARDFFADSRLFFGEDASEVKAKALAGRAGAVVFALHGVFDGTGPMGSYLQMAPGGDDDGRLTVAEVMELDLPRAPLVILSACETGRGARVRGYGWMSLADAFMVAGARSVVNTLWRVDDLATRAFMESFYAELRKNRSPEDALRNVQLTFLSGRLDEDALASGTQRGVLQPVTAGQAGRTCLPRDVTHPYFWGGFVVVGSLR